MVVDTERDMVEALIEALETNDVDLEVERTSSFEEVGLLTKNAGVIVRLANGREFQLTVVQSA
ncbi:MAG: hypothetical protein KGR26_11190 [Cyanobacteria bacterium REEB65]|nr:hypothetical protein [Cyanobacteria bacterium REEB65]